MTHRLVPTPAPVILLPVCSDNDSDNDCLNVDGVAVEMSTSCPIDTGSESLYRCSSSSSSSSNSSGSSVCDSNSSIDSDSGIDSGSDSDYSTNGSTNIPTYSCSLLLELVSFLSELHMKLTRTGTGAHTGSDTDTYSVGFDVTKLCVRLQAIIQCISNYIAIQD